MKRRAMKAAAEAPAPMKRMKAMKAMKKKAAMKRRAMKAAAEAPAPMKRMKAMKVMKKKKDLQQHSGADPTLEKLGLQIMHENAGGFSPVGQGSHGLLDTGRIDASGGSNVCC